MLYDLSIDNVKENKRGVDLVICKIAINALNESDKIERNIYLNLLLVDWIEALKLNESCCKHI